MIEQKYNDVIIKLQHYMFFQQNIDNSLIHFNKSDNNVKKNNYGEKKNYGEKNSCKNDFFIPKEKDTLFWCFYLIKYGYSQYEYPGNTSFLNEKNVKFKLIEFLRTHKTDLKNHKIKNIQDIEDELANKEIIGLKTFISLCICSNINIILIDNRKYYELLIDNEQPFHIIHHNISNNKYSYEININNDKISFYKNNFFKLESFEKPIKSITYYKVEKLVNIYNKLRNNNGENCEKKTKKELYESILLIL